jgi:hypothetical protein
MFEPKNEQGVVALFMMGLSKSKWELVEIGMPFPDATLSMDDALWKVEFEFLASNFVSHGHDYRECDLIICWRNDLSDCPLPILALSESGWEKRKPVKGNPLSSEVQFWKNRASKLEREVNKLKAKEQGIGAICSKKPSILRKMIAYYTENPHFSVREMADLVGISKSSVANYLDELGQKNIVHVNGNGVEVLRDL